MTVEQQIFDEVADFASKYEAIPDGAKTREELEAHFPHVPKGGLSKWLGAKVKSGEWKSGRKSNVTYYWPAE